MFMLLAKNAKYLCCKRPPVKDIAFLRSFADFVCYCVHEEGYLLPADSPSTIFQNFQDLATMKKIHKGLLF